MKAHKLSFLFLFLLIGKSFADDPDVCIYEHPDFKGWKYCTNAQGFQDLSRRYDNQLSSLIVPEGYKLNFFDKADGRGRACVFYGQVRQVSDECNDMASAILLKVDQEAVNRKAEEEQAAAAQAEAVAQADAAARAQEEQAAAAAQADAQLKAGSVCYTYDDGSFSSAFLEAISGGTSGLPCLQSGYELAYVGDDANDDIETVFVRGNYTEVTLYEDSNFQGRSVTLTCGQYELIDDPENEVSSIRTRVLDEPEKCNMAIKQEVTRWGQ